MTRKLLITHGGTILNVLPVDHKWGKRDLDGGRYEKLVDDTEANIEHMRRRRMKADLVGKLALLPEAEWPETIQAKEEQFEEVKQRLMDFVTKDNVIENPDGSFDIKTALATPIEKVL